jgi:hypothetical protein
VVVTKRGIEAKVILVILSGCIYWLRTEERQKSVEKMGAF